MKAQHVAKRAEHVVRSVAFLDAQPLKIQQRALDRAHDGHVMLKGQPMNLEKQQIPGVPPLLKFRGLLCGFARMPTFPKCVKPAENRDPDGYADLPIPGYGLPERAKSADALHLAQRHYRARSERSAG